MARAAGANEGKKGKKKGIKAKVTSKFGSKRKLSRMGKKVKKGEMGPNTEFITRSAALKRLQITLKDFRRLCILKGVYPRVPTKGPKGNDKVYYDIKDISYIMHEPLLKKFRDFKSFMKKIRKSAGRNQFSEARRKDELKPQFTLDHLVKERYPRFVDALRDLDDALCMVHLFAALPSQGRILAERTTTCATLSKHWQYYVSRTRSLHKMFISVKGVYFQAVVMGEPVHWLVPHKFTQALPREVDIRVMLTFLDFYEVLLKFVLYKLFHLQGLQYPPVQDSRLAEDGAFLLAFNAEKISEDGDDAVTTGAESTTTAEKAAAASAAASAAAAVTAAAASAADSKNSKGGKEKNKKEAKPDKKTSKKLESLPQLFDTITGSGIGDEDEDEDEEGLADLAAPLAAAFSGLQDSTESAKEDSKEDEEERRKVFNITTKDARSDLFKDLVFFFNREIPIEFFQISTLAMGAKIGWAGEGSPLSVDDPRITHQVVDRPMQGAQSTKREYVQPQWICDSVNCELLLPVSDYRPGSKLPPHLSPFVDDDKEGYLPRYREALRQLKGESDGTNNNNSNAKSAFTPKETAAAAAAKEKKGSKKGGEEDYSKDVKAERSGKKSRKEEEEDEEEEEEEGESEGESEDEDNEAEDSEEDSEVDEEPLDPNKGVKSIVYKQKDEKKLTEDEEHAELSKMMMSKKSKRLYGRMQHGIEKKQDANQVLTNKRQKAEKEAAKASKTPKAAAAAAAPKVGAKKTARGR